MDDLLEATQNGLKDEFSFLPQNSGPYDVVGGDSIDVIHTKKFIYVCTIITYNTSIEICFANYSNVRQIKIDDIADPNFDPQKIIDLIRAVPNKIKVFEEGGIAK